MSTANELAERGRTMPKESIQKSEFEGLQDEFKTLSSEHNQHTVELALLNQYVRNGLTTKINSVYRVLWLLVGAVIINGIVQQLLP